MPPGRLGFVVGQRAGRDQVRGDPIGALLAQSAQVTADVEVQRIGGRPLRQLRPGLADVFLAAAGTPFGLALDVGGTVTVLGPPVTAATAVTGAAGPTVRSLDAGRRSVDSRRWVGRDGRPGSGATVGRRRRSRSPVGSLAAGSRNPWLRSPPNADGLAGTLAAVARRRPHRPASA